jgi:hypothetical protein
MRSSWSSPLTMLILGTIVPLVAVVMISIPHQASAEVCISIISNHDDNNNNNNNNADTSCNNQQNSNSDDHSTVKDKTPFLLAIPFP